MLLGNIDRQIDKQKKQKAKAEFIRNERALNKVRSSAYNSNVETEQNLNDVNIEDYLRGMNSNGYAFKSIILYVLDYLMGDRNSFNVELLYLPYIMPNAINFRTFLRHVVTGIFVHGGIHLQYQMDANMLSLATNWDSRLLSAPFLCTELIPEVIRENGSVCTVFSPDRVPTGASANYLNGIFSSYLEEFMDMSYQRLLFLIKIRNLSMNVITAEPSPTFLQDMMKIKSVTSDEDYQNFVQRNFVDDVNSRIRSSDAAISAITSAAASNGSEKQYSRRLLKDIQALFDFSKGNLEVNRSADMLWFDEEEGLRNQEVQNTIVSTVPVGMHTKHHIPNIIGEHLFEDLVARTIRKIVTSLHLDTNPAQLLESIRAECEDILNLIFAFYITPATFHKLIYEDVEKELTQIQLFYNEVYIITVQDQLVNILKEKRFEQMYRSEYKLLQGFFQFNFFASIRQLTLKEEIERMLSEHILLKDMYEETVVQFENDSSSGDLLALRSPTVRITWGKSKPIVPFVLSSVKRESSSEEKKERAESSQSRLSMAAERSENKDRSGD